MENLGTKKRRLGRTGQNGAKKDGLIRPRVVSEKDKGCGNTNELCSNHIVGRKKGRGADALFGTSRKRRRFLKFADLPRFDKPYGRS